MTPLHTERLILRDWCDDDLPAFARINADPRVAEFLPSVLTRAQSDDLAIGIRAGIAKHGYGWWAVEVIGGASFVGFVGLQPSRLEAPFTPCVEIGWRLDADHWNQGYATESAHAAATFGFDELGLDEIVSFTVPQNLASRRVMEKLGMTHSADEEFDHPSLPDGHPLSRHVLYRLKSPHKR